MLLTRTSAVLVGGGILAALIASPALIRPDALKRSEPTRPFTTPPAAAPVEPPRVDALAARRAAAVQASRNPFVFATRLPPPPPPAAAVPAVDPVAESPRPPVTLSAIAEQPGENGATIRTAVLLVAGQVFLVGEGDHATSRFTIVRIAADVVELRDEETGMLLRLALR